MTHNTDPRDVERAYNLIDRFLRNNLGDTDYAEYSAALDEVRAALSEQAQPEQDAQRVERDWKQIEASIHAFVEDYEMVGEDEGGRDGCYTPNENERALITDAIMGLLSDDDFIAAYTPPAPPPAPIINGKPATAHSLLAALLDIYDDHQKNPPEHRCYVDSAWSDVLNEARQFLATPEPTQATGGEALATSAAPAGQESVADGCGHDWRPFFTGPNQTHVICAHCDEKRPVAAAQAEARKPLTREQIDKIWHGMGSFTSNDHRIFARAIEAAHGITAEDQNHG